MVWVGGVNSFARFGFSVRVTIFVFDIMATVEVIAGSTLKRLEALERAVSGLAAQVVTARKLILDLDDGLRCESDFTARQRLRLDEIVDHLSFKYNCVVEE